MKGAPQAVGVRLRSPEPATGFSHRLSALRRRRHERLWQQLATRERLAREGRGRRQVRDQVAELGWPRPW